MQGHWPKVCSSKKNKLWYMKYMAQIWRYIYKKEWKFFQNVLSLRSLHVCYFFTGPILFQRVTKFSYNLHIITSMWECKQGNVSSFTCKVPSPSSLLPIPILVHSFARANSNYVGTMTIYPLWDRLYVTVVLRQHW